MLNQKSGFLLQFGNPPSILSPPRTNLPSSPLSLAYSTLPHYPSQPLPASRAITSYPTPCHNSAHLCAWGSDNTGSSLTKSQVGLLLQGELHQRRLPLCHKGKGSLFPCLPGRRACHEVATAASSGRNLEVTFLALLVVQRQSPLTRVEHGANPASPFSTMPGAGAPQALP